MKTLTEILQTNASDLTEQQKVWVIESVKVWLGEHRECPQEPLTKKQIEFYYRTFDHLIECAQRDGDERQ